MSEELVKAQDDLIAVLSYTNRQQRDYIVRLEKVIEDDERLIETLHRWIGEKNATDTR